MRDAQQECLQAPEGVTAASLRCLLSHVYTDSGVQDVALDQLPEVLHVAAFYGCSRLVLLCETRLAQVLTEPEVRDMQPSIIKIYWET